MQPSPTPRTSFDQTLGWKGNSFYSPKSSVLLFRVPWPASSPSSPRDQTPYWFQEGLGTSSLGTPKQLSQVPFSCVAEQLHQHQASSLGVDETSGREA